MKLLFDENLSPKLPSLLSSHFPDSIHVRDCGLKGFPDEDIWEYALIIMGHKREIDVFNNDPSESVLIIS